MAAPQGYEFASGDVAHDPVFVVCVQMTPRALLGRGGRIVLGRGMRADVKLDDATCSREHLELTLDRHGSLPSVRDLGSRNGLRLRGREIREGILPVGEVLEVGSSSITIERRELVAPPALLEDSQELSLDFPFDAGRPFEEALSPGRGEQILRELAKAERTGTLEVELPQGKIELVFARGRLASLRGAVQPWSEAIHAVVSAASGRCRYRTSFEVRDTTPLSISIEDVLARARSRVTRPFETRSGPILVVEDDLDLRTSACEALEGEGFVAVGAADGRDAVRILKALPAPPALIVLDLDMAGMDGSEFREWQRGRTELADVPVVVVSGVPDLAERGKKLDVDDVVAKPLAPGALIERVRRYVAI